MELEEVLVRARRDSASPHVSVIGVGGAGCILVGQLIALRESSKVQCVAVYHDPKALAALGPLVKTIRLGHRFHGLGCFGRAVITPKDLDAIGAAVRQPGVSILMAGLGGHCGNDFAPLIARHLSSLGLLTIAVATLPFRFEGERKSRRAKESLEALGQSADAIVVLPNQKILDENPESGQWTLKQAFKAADDRMLQTVRPILARLSSPRNSE